MHKNPVFWLKWIASIGFAVLGVFLYTAIHGHGFLGLICMVIAGIIGCYCLIGMIKEQNFMAVKILHTGFTSVLCIGLLAVAVTETVIIRGSHGEPEKEVPYVIVLGCKVNGTTPSLSLQDRIHAAYDYLSKFPNTIAVLSGGKGTDERISEAQCMFNELTAKGIAPERLWLEEKATSTKENLQYSLDLIEEKTGTRPNSIGLLSSEYHLYRGGLYAKACGVEAVGIPAKTSWPTIKLNYYLREVGGVWYHLILGG